jgi:hypothetical protein
MHHTTLRYSNSIFILVAVMLQYALGYIRPLSTILQSESCDLVKAHQEARNLVLLFQGIREDSDAKFHDLYERSVSIANENDVLPTKPRSTPRQRHRANALVESIPLHWRSPYHCLPCFKLLVTALSIESENTSNKIPRQYYYQ